MRFPLLRLPIALVFVVPVFLAQSGVLYLAPRFGRMPMVVASGFVACLLGPAMYALYLRLVEKRGPTEFARAGAAGEFGLGLAIGALLFSVTIGTIALLGGYRVTAVRSDLSLLAVPLALSLGAGVLEEILARAVIFRLVEASLGSWIALVASAILFGLGHVNNPNATVFSGVAIVLEAGILLAAAYMLTRRLWLAIGIHVAWNFTQSGLFGVPTSGLALKGVLVSALIGPPWLSGGAFGAEGSVVAVGWCVVAGVTLLVLAIRRGQLVRPYWRRAPPPLRSAP